jgi:thiazole synthase
MGFPMSISLTVNGETRRIASGATVADLVADIGLNPAKVAVERNGEIAPRSTLADVVLGEGDVLEIVHFVGGGDVTADDSWSVAGRTFRSRLIVGTGKYKDFAQNAAALEASGAEIVTVAVRRECVGPQGADADRLHRSEESHLPAQHRRLLHRRGCHPYPAPCA